MYLLADITYLFICNIFIIIVICLNLNLLLFKCAFYVLNN